MQSFKFFKLILLSLLAFILVACLGENTTSYTLSYSANANGSIDGASLQTVNRGSNGTAVRAVANAGYYFTTWSDGSSQNPRSDKNVQSNISVSASFSKTSSNVIVLDELKAFPTAEGAGSHASGGRGGKVIYVTNRNASGDGSLKQALLTEGRRTIVFAIGGRFNLDEAISLGQPKILERKDGSFDTFNEDFDKYSNFTLAGQTANDKGGVHLANNGITLKRGEEAFTISGQENIVLRYFDSRYNWQWFYIRTMKEHVPSIRFVDVNNLIVDHVTSGWSSYGFIVTNYNMTPRKVLGNITIQRSLVHEGTMIPSNITARQHNHNVGMLLGRKGHGGEYNEWNMMGEFSIIKNAYIGVSHRFPNIAGSDAAKFSVVNNYMYGFLGDSRVRLARTAGNSENDFINNVFQRTPYSPEFTNRNLLAYDFGNFMPAKPKEILNRPNFHISGNLFLDPTEKVLNITSQIQRNPALMLFRWENSSSYNYPQGNLNKEDHHLILRDKPINSANNISVIASEKVKANILNNVGGNVRFRNNGETYIDDLIDNKYINEWAKNNGGPRNMAEFKGTTELGNSVRFVYPEYSTAPAKNLDTYDSDGDGIPNDWEDAHGLINGVANNTTISKGEDRKWFIGPYTVINKAGYTDLEIYLADIAGDFHMLANQGK